MARTAAVPRPALAGHLHRSLATVSHQVPLGSGTSIPVDLDDQQTKTLRPTDEMQGFDISAQESSTPSQENVGRPIYLDAQATTPMDPRVLDAMLPYMTNMYGNPHSKTHSFGWEAESAVDDARAHVANLIGAQPKDIVFTSGATESNNTAVKGIARFYKGKKKHIITTQTEHKCVLDSCRVLQDEGFDVTYLPVGPNGVVDLDLLERSIRPDTCLVSVMMVNNEIGTIQPIREIGAIVKRHKGVFFHTDAAQAVGKIPVDVDDLNIDVLSISAHKLYGPKGIGALYVRRRPRVRLEPIMSGGGQERGLRSGTVPAPLVVGFGEACRLAKKEMAADHQHIRTLAERLYTGITRECERVVRNGDVEGYPGCTNLSFAAVEGESLLMSIKDIAVSSGSACTSASLEPSYVLRALGAEEDMAHSSIRFGIGRFTTEEEVDYVVDKVVRSVKRLRDLSPLWEMLEEGIDLKSIDWSASEH
ncbi:cysteine desulfurase NFS1 [Rhodotorula diobovata]|uniref:cysteine desulfurase n=1 Tax=Rhodotorula diobovata TaxID=5288 RepID=A0A5C5FZQ7_9BASI|nr:cysteine desulfurase NFS1 [Rhodotorula diobovata]